MVDNAIPASCIKIYVVNLINVPIAQTTGALFMTLPQSDTKRNGDHYCALRKRELVFIVFHKICKSLALRIDFPGQNSVTIFMAVMGIEPFCIVQNEISHQSY